MDEERRQRYEDLLLEAREQADRDLHRIEEEESEPQSVSAGDTPRFTGGADAASDVQEEETDFIQISRLSDRVDEIDEALRILRDDPEEYETCRRCGETIHARRLEMVPWTRLCADCAEEVEEQEAGSPR